MIKKEIISPFEHAAEITGMLQPGILLNTNGSKFNGMVIGWGALGVLWGKPVFTVYVRQSRFTKGELDNTGAFTVSVPLGAPMEKEIFRVFGSLSGRDVDKAAYVTLSEPEVNGVPGVLECPLTLECKVLYRQDQVLSEIPKDVRARYYNRGADDGDFHTVYVGEIVSAYILRQ